MAAPGALWIERTGDRVLDLVDNVLRSAHLESGTSQLEGVPVKLGEFGREVLNGLADLALQKVQRISLQIEGDDGIVPMDRQLVSMVLDNLLINAIKYTGQGGKLQLVIRPAPALVTIEVRDREPGMTSDRAARVFGKFSRLAAGAAEKGSGLDPWTAKKVVELHGGDIWVTRTPGEGPAFTFTIVPQTGSLDATD